MSDSYDHVPAGDHGYEGFTYRIVEIFPSPMFKRTTAKVNVRPSFETQLKNFYYLFIVALAIRSNLEFLTQTIFYSLLTI